MLFQLIQLKKKQLTILDIPTRLHDETMTITTLKNLGGLQEVSVNL